MNATDPAARAAQAERREGAGANPTDPAERRQRWLRIALPVAIGVLTLLAWDLVVRLNQIPHYILPGPLRVAEAMVDGWDTLWPALLVTVRITFMALAVAVIGGVGLALLFAQSKWIEISFFPYAVVLQVTPIIAIAPLILIYVDNTHIALLICAWIVAFFPILSNTTLGLNSADHNLLDLFKLYGASRWQVLRYLRIPSALPYFLGGLRIAGGLSLIGAVVAEFTAGTAGKGSGLAYRILETGYRLNIPLMFAALALITLTGVLIFILFTALSHLLLHKWHESAVKRES
ncbi:MAG: ABC transporter permease [Burkholderiales bacterium]|nr:ABC transporter permease [Burkholderiales bacterium]